MNGSLVATRDSWMENDSTPVTTRVLLVEDHEGFRSYLRSALAQRKELELVGAAGDGLEAVEKCRELQPELVLMDIGLPRLNGLDAARRILAESPKCRIVFLTQEHAPEILEEASKLGASGYVLKTRAARDLFPAMQAARDGSFFFCSAVLRGQAASRHDPYPKVPSQDCVPLPARKPADRHEMHVYPDEPSFAAGMASFIESSLKDRKIVLALICESHRDRLFQALTDAGVDVTAALQAGLFVSVYVNELLSPLLVDGLLNLAGMKKASQQLWEDLFRSHPGDQFVACGECAPTLYACGQAEAALQVERVWDELAERYKVPIFCAYIQNGPPHDKAVFEEISQAHSLVAVH